jgi:hypothetical protein
MFNMNLSNLKEAVIKRLNDKTTAELLINSFEASDDGAKLILNVTVTENNEANDHMIGDEMKIWLNFSDKNGDCPSATMEFLRAFYPTEMSDGSMSPDKFSTLPDMVFTVNAKHSEWQGKTYVNYNGFKKLGTLASMANFD